MSEAWAQWKHLPETQEFLSRIKELVQEAREGPLLDPCSSDRTQANVARRDGKIEAYEDVWSIINEKIKGGGDG